jgi:hypothetical protein
MKLLVLVSLLFLSLFNLPVFAQEMQVVVPYTQADRDRAIRNEAKLNALIVGSKGINARFDNIDKQFICMHKQLDDLKTILYWGFGIIIALLMFMFGYMIWDRRMMMMRLHGMA